MQIPSLLHPPGPQSPSNSSTAMYMALSRCPHIRGIATGSPSLMTSLTSKHLLKQKSETFAAFKQFKAWAENVTGAKLGTLRDDKGGEYMSREFEVFCIENGIQRQHTVRNHPQQNGVAERSTIGRWMRVFVVSILYESGMPTAFWGEALATFIYTSNRLLTSVPQHSQTALHMRLSMEPSQICLCFMFEAVMPMCSSRGTSYRL